MPVSTHDLVGLETVQDAILKSDAEDALTREVFNSSGDFSDDGIRGISVASSRIKDYLKRNLIVQKYTIYLKSEDWEQVERVPDPDYDYRLNFSRIKEWPVLQVDEDVKTLGDRQVFAKDDTFSELNFTAGYRRSDQVLTDFNSNIQSEFASEDEIPTLPDTIVDVACNIAIHNAVVRISGLIGKEVSEQQIGDFSTTVRRETEREGYEGAQLKRISQDRFFV